MLNLDIPIVALVGRANVGKSTLFNYLTASRDALVLDIPGVTRDCQSGQCNLGIAPFTVIDTAGLELDAPKVASKNGHGGPSAIELDLIQHSIQHSLAAVKQANIVVFVVDAIAGLTALDMEVADKLRISGKTIILAINKSEKMAAGQQAYEFHKLGFSHVVAIAAKYRRGTQQLLRILEQRLGLSVAEENIEIAEEPELFEEISEELSPEISGAIPVTDTEKAAIRVALIGRPNVGKSTLINRILGSEQVIASEHPGTTRTSIKFSHFYRDQEYQFIDTAGIRRKAKCEGLIEKYSVQQSLQAITDADVVLVMLDAQSGICEQDLRLLQSIVTEGKALVVVVNKIDQLTSEQRLQVKQNLYRLHFVRFAEVQYISAKHGTGVGELFKLIKKCYLASHKHLPTAQLTKILQLAVKTHQPPLVNGRRIQLRYAHIGGQNPLTIVIHGNQTSSTPESYQRFLAHFFREQLRLVGTPLKIIFKNNRNPYVDFDLNEPGAGPRPGSNNNPKKSRGGRARSTTVRPKAPPRRASVKEIIA